MSSKNLKYQATSLLSELAKNFGVDIDLNLGKINKILLLITCKKQQEEPAGKATLKFTYPNFNYTCKEENTVSVVSLNDPAQNTAIWIQKLVNTWQ